MKWPTFFQRGAFVLQEEHPLVFGFLRIQDELQVQVYGLGNSPAGVSDTEVDGRAWHTLAVVRAVFIFQNDLLVWSYEPGGGFHENYWSRSNK